TAAALVLFMARSPAASQKSPGRDLSTIKGALALPVIVLAVLVSGQLLYQTNKVVIKAVAIGAFVDSKPGPNRQIQIFDRFNFNLKDLPLRGNQAARNVIVALLDYPCHACRLMHGHLADAQKTFGDDLTVVLLPTPLDSACNPSVKQQFPDHTNGCEYARLAL